MLAPPPHQDVWGCARVAFAVMPTTTLSPNARPLGFRVQEKPTRVMLQHVACLRPVLGVSRSKKDRAYYKVLFMNLGVGPEECDPHRGSLWIGGLLASAARVHPGDVLTPATTRRWTTIGWHRGGPGFSRTPGDTQRLRSVPVFREVPTQRTVSRMWGLLPPPPPRDPGLR